MYKKAQKYRLTFEKSKKQHTYFKRNKQELTFCSFSFQIEFSLK